MPPAVARRIAPLGRSKEVGGTKPGVKKGARRRREEVRSRTCVAPESGRKGEPGTEAEKTVEGGGDDDMHSSSVVSD